MKFQIMHESTGRIRVRMLPARMTLEQADLLEAYLQGLEDVRQAAVHERTGCAVIRYRGDREALLRAVSRFSYRGAAGLAPSHSARALNRAYQEKLAGMVACKAARALFLPSPLRAAWAVWQAAPYLFRGLRCLLRRQLHVELLDGLSIGVSLLRRDFATASSVTFLLGLGELLEEWTHKKSVEDLARSMSLNIDKVWVKTPSGEVLTPLPQVRTGDLAAVRMGGVIPLDGVIQEGEVMVNQASLTGESVPVAKGPGAAVYAGTVVEEGACVLRVTQQSGSSRYDKIVAMIEQSEKLKSAAESKAAGLADKLVPYTLAGSALAWLLTGNVTRGLSVLMVDFSCALKLAMPLAVLSAMREAGGCHAAVKGGKFLEAIARADTIVFDKTGTLTRACPRVTEIVTFGGRPEGDMLRLAACLEEHFPHSMANAVVRAARERDLAHREMHSQVEYVVAHGIASTVGAEKVLIGSAHFIFEDETVRRPRRGAGQVRRPAGPLLPPVSGHRRGAGGGDLHRRSPAGGGGGGHRRPAAAGHPQDRHAHRRQPAHGGRHRRPGGGGRIPGRGAAGGQGGLCGGGAGQGPHRHHAGGRHQRLPGPVRRQRGHRRQRRRRHCPGDRRRHHRGGGPAGAGEAAGAGHGPDAADRRQLPLCHRLQRRPHRPGGRRGAGPRRLRHAPQPVHPGGEPAEHDQPAAGIKRFRLAQQK